jgi:hypothetical protein
MYYLLEKNHKLIKTDLITWIKFFKNFDRIVKQEDIGNTKISTVFLGIDHNFGKGKPLLFETIIFGGEHDQYQDRCSTWEQAEKMHQKAIDLVKNT